MKKPLNNYEQGLNLVSTVTAIPLNQTGQGRYHSDIDKFYQIWHHNQSQSGTKTSNTVRLMRDRWWSNCARFIKKAGKKLLVPDGVTPRTARQSNVKLLFTVKGQPSIHTVYQSMKKGR